MSNIYTYRVEPCIIHIFIESSHSHIYIYELWLSLHRRVMYISSRVTSHIYILGRIRFDIYIYRVESCLIYICELRVSPHRRVTYISSRVMCHIYIYRVESRLIYTYEIRLSPHRCVMYISSRVTSHIYTYRVESRLIYIYELRLSPHRRVKYISSRVASHIYTYRVESCLRCIYRVESCLIHIYRVESYPIYIYELRLSPHRRMMYKPRRVMCHIYIHRKSSLYLPCRFSQLSIEIPGATWWNTISTRWGWNFIGDPHDFQY